MMILTPVTLAVTLAISVIIKQGYGEDESMGLRTENLRKPHI